MEEKYIHKAKRTAKTKHFKHIAPTDKQLYQMARLHKFINETQQLKRSVFYTTVHKMISSGVDNAFVERLLRAQRISKTGITLAKCLILYGRDGYRRWKVYTDKQAETNTFEYKAEKHGMSREEFDRYNQSRSNSKENFIKRYGEKDGTNKWDSYRKRQAYAGVVIDYFIEKYGEVKGTSLYNEIRLKKSHSVAGIMARNPDMDENEAIKILEDTMFNSGAGGYSKKSQNFLWRVYDKLSDQDKENCYFAELNKEFGKYDRQNKCYRKYDFTLTNRKIIIEFNGDYFHANPSRYLPSHELFFNMTAAEVWEQDNHKISLVEDLGYTVIIVWESDYDSHPEELINRCIDAIKNS